MPDDVGIIDWNSLFSHGEFWKSYYMWEEYSFQVVDLWLKQLGLFKSYDPDCEDPNTDGLPHEILLTVPLRSGFGLEWSFFTPYGASSNLYLLHPGLGRVQIGNTAGDFATDTFRWDERRAIIDAAAECWQAGFEFRFLPPLLGVYLAGTPADASEANAAQLRAELEALGVLNDEESAWLATAVLHGDEDDRRWELDPTRGWVFSGHGYSSRDKRFGEESVFRAMDDFFKALNLPGENASNKSMHPTADT